MSAALSIDDVMSDAAVGMQVLKLMTSLKKPLQVSVGPHKHFTIDFANHQVTKGKSSKPVEVAIEIATEEDFAALSDGRLQPMQAFMSGKIKAKGNLSVLMKLQPLQGQLDAARTKRQGSSKL